MLTQKALNGLGFDSILDLYTHIVWCKENGSPETSRELFSMLSKKKKEDFFVYLQDTELYSEYYLEVELRDFLTQ